MILKKSTSQVALLSIASLKTVYKFKYVILRKCEFWNPTFENCQIERSNLKRANFHKGTFRNYIFIKANLTASNFSEFEFIKTKCNNSDLNLIGAQFIKV